MPWNIVGTVIQSNLVSFQIRSFPYIEIHSTHALSWLSCHAFHYVNWRLRKHSFSAGSFYKYQICILWLNGAIFLSHSRCVDSLNPHKCKIQNYLSRKLRISNSQIKNFLFANYRCKLILKITFFIPFRFVNYTKPSQRQWQSDFYVSQWLERTYNLFPISETDKVDKCLLTSDQIKILCRKRKKPNCTKKVKVRGLWGNST